MRARAKLNLPAWRSVLACNLGLCVAAPVFLMSFSLYLKPMAEEFGWTRSEIMFGLSIASVIAALVTPFVGIYLDQVGPRRVALIGCLLLPLSVALLGMTPPSYPIYLLLAAFGGVACAFVAPPTFISLLPQWFDRRFGTAISIAVTGIGLGAVIIPLATQAFVTHLGWRGATLAVALSVLAIGLMNNRLLFKENPEYLGQCRVMTQEIGDGHVIGHTFRDGVRTRDFWLYSLSFMLVIAVVSGCSLNLVALLTDRGFSPTEAAASLATIGIASSVARVVTGIALDRLPLAVPALIFFFGGALGLLMLGLAWPAGNIVVATGLLGMAMGCEGDLIPYVLKRRFGMRAYGRLYGLMFGIFQIGLVLGPLLVASVYDLYGSYDVIFPVFAGVMAAAALLITLTRGAWASPKVEIF
ncbi:MFS transporter [Sphingobium xenophagum]